MKERPIILRTPMVRAVLAGRKSQTRRVARHQDVDANPFGQPGDRLWVRETWAEVNGGIFYRADGDWPDNRPKARWRTPIFMPRSASRIVLELTAVRVERLQDCSAEDAIAEGLEVESSPDGCRHRWPAAGFTSHPDPRAAYAEGWDSINGKAFSRAWADNPWVWVISFKRKD